MGTQTPPLHQDEHANSHAGQKRQPRIVILFNPGARLTQEGACSPEMLVDGLRARGLEAVVQTGESSEGAVAQAEQAALDGASVVIAVGGDGTIHAVVEGLLRARQHTILGIIPGGTMNNVAAALGIPETLDEALDVIAEGVRNDHSEPMDVGMLGDHPFVEVVGLGMEAALIPVGEQVKDSPSAIPEAFASLVRILRRFRPARVDLRVDGKRYTVRAMEITVCNTPSYGARFAAAPDARMDDGKLDLVVFEGTSGWELLRHTFASIGGHNDAHARLRRFTGRSISIRPRTRWPLQLDGVHLFNVGRGLPVASVEVWAKQEALRVFAPATRPNGKETEEGIIQTALRAAPPAMAPVAAMASAVDTATKQAVNDVSQKVSDLAQTAQQASKPEAKAPETAQSAPPVEASQKSDPTISVPQQAAQKVEAVLDAPPTPAIAPAVVRPRRAARRLALLRAGYFVAGGVTLVAALAVRRTGILPGDLAITRAIQRRRTPLLDRVMTALVWPGFSPQSGLLVVGTTGLLWVARLRVEAIFIALTSGLNALNYVLKRVIRRNRPTDPLVRVTRVISEPSFPSGHVMQYVGFFGLLAAMAIANLRPSKLRTALVTVCGAFISTVGVARVYLGAHWPSDVGVGYLLGGAYLGGLLELYTRAKRKQAATTTKRAPTS